MQPRFSLRVPRLEIPPHLDISGIERTKLVSALRYFMVITDGIAKGEVGRSTLQGLRGVHSPSLFTV